MTGTVGLSQAATEAAASRRRRLVRSLWMGLGALLLLSVVESVTGISELTSSGTFGAALRLTIPIMLAGLGAIYSERAGIVNIGLEGMMIMGTWFGAWAGWAYGPWWGVVAGLVGGAIGGLIHAIGTVSFGIDHIVSGVAINLLAAGGMRFLSVVAFPPGSGGGATQSPRVDGSIGVFNLPFVAGGELFGWQSPDVFGWLEAKGWFLVSDLGAFLKGLTGNISWLTLLGLALVPVTYYVLWRTPWGLRLRSCGEAPVAAESLGVPVYRMKYYGVVISGALAGLGGAFLVLVQASIYREGQTAGRGFIGLATLIFGNWRPSGVLAGGALFGFADALRLRQGEAVHALLLFVAIGLAVFMVRAGMRRAWRTVAVLGVVAAVSLVWYFNTTTIPNEFISFTPHLTTLLVLSLATQRLRMPAADGMRYRKGEAT